MSSLTEEIVAKLHGLPESDLREVLLFVDFLNWRSTDSEDPFLKIAGVLSGESMSSAEIDEKLYGNSSRE